jgi:hypothetical protein
MRLWNLGKSFWVVGAVLGRDARKAAGQLGRCDGRDSSQVRPLSDAAVV